MSKRGGDSTRTYATKVKKRRGVGSRRITVLDSDEEDTFPKVPSKYARVMKTRVTTSGKVERIATSSVPVYETEVNVHTLPELNIDGSVDTAVENVILAVPKRKREKANNSVSSLIFQLSLHR